MSFSKPPIASMRAFSSSLRYSSACRSSHSSGISPCSPSKRSSMPLKYTPKHWSKRSKCRSSFTSAARARA